MTFDATLLLRLTGTQTNPLDLGTASYPLNALVQTHLTDGAGLNQGNRVFTDTRTLAASASEDLDLTGGLTDAFGNAITFARVKGLIVVAASANTNNVVVGGDTNAVLFGGAAAHTVTVRPGGFFALSAPDATAYAVTASTADILQIANSGAGSSVTYDLVVIGAAS